MPKALGSKHRKGQTMLRVWLILPLLCLLQACSSAYLNRPVIEDKVGDPWFGFSQKGVGTLAITAERKVVVVNFKNNRFCAEPPQDFGQAIKAMAEIVAAYKREKPEDALGTTHDANLSFKNSMETTLKEVAKQPYGIMFLRYQSSFLCQMFANAALSDDEYRDFADKTMDRAYEILGKEVELELIRAKIKAAGNPAASKGKAASAAFETPRLVIGTAGFPAKVRLPSSLTSGFYEMSLGFREFGTLTPYSFQPINENGNNILLNDNTIKVLSVTSSAESYESGDLLESSIKVVLIKGANPQFYRVPGTIVFYKAGDEKIKLLTNQQTLTWDELNKEDQKLTFLLPKHVEQGYKDFNKLRMLSAQVDVDEVDESFDVEVKPVEKSDTQWIVKLKLDKENQKKYEKHHKDHRIALTFKASSIDSLDVPKVVGVITVSKNKEENNE